MRAPVNYALSGGLIVSPVAVGEAKAAVDGAANAASTNSEMILQCLEVMAVYATPMAPIVGVILGLAQLYRTMTAYDDDEEESDV